MQPSNVDLSGGAGHLKLPGGSTHGAEIRSVDAYSYGRFEARIRVPDAPSSLTGFFLYEPPDGAQEIDIEIFNDRTGRVMFTYYCADQQVSRTHQLPFDPTESFHGYSFDYRADTISFFVDGTLMDTLRGELPIPPLRLHLNAWFPTWCEGQTAAGDRFVRIEHVLCEPHDAVVA